MPPKSKTDPAPVETADAVEPVTDDMSDSDEMATVLETLAEHAERLDRIEAAQREPGDDSRRFRDLRQAAAAQNDPVFRAQVGQPDRARRRSEGERQDEIEQANARRHLHERAGDGTVTQPMTSGVPAPGSGDRTEDRVESAASPNFEDEGGEAQISDDERNVITTDDTAALNPPR